MTFSRKSFKMRRCRSACTMVQSVYMFDVLLGKFYSLQNVAYQLATTHQADVAHHRQAHLSPNRTHENEIRLADDKHIFTMNIENRLAQIPFFRRDRHKKGS